MNNMQVATEFLGWCAVINIGLLLFYTAWMSVFRNFTKNVHSKWFGIDPDKLDVIYFQYLANFKVAVIVLSIVPYLALKMMA